MDLAEQATFAANCALNHDLGCLNRTMLRPEFYHLAYLVAGLLAVLGVSQLIGGLTYRSMLEVTCATCKRRVIGKKVLFGIRCPVGPHKASQYFGKLVLLVALVIVIIVLGASAR